MQFFALLNGRPTIFQGLYLDGGPANPAISFANDQTTGFYKVGAAPGVVYFGALGSGSLRFAGSGYLYAGQSNSFLQLSSAGTITLSVDTTSNGSIVFETVGTGTHVFRNLSGLGTRTRVEIAQTGLRVFYIENTAVGGNLAFGDGAGEIFRLSGTSKNFLIATTTDNALGKLQVAGSITTNEISGTGLFGYFGGADLIVGSLNSTGLILRTNNIAALTINSSQVSTFSGLVITAAAAAASAGLRLPHGAAPTAPVNGDIWTTTAGLFVRVNGATVGPLT